MLHVHGTSENRPPVRLGHAGSDAPEAVYHLTYTMAEIGS